MIGWPGSSDRKAEQARAEWIVPNMFTFYVTGKKSLEESVSWAEGELQRSIRARHRADRPLATAGRACGPACHLGGNTYAPCVPRGEEPL